MPADVLNSDPMPMAYHRAIVAHLWETEPGLWNWFASTQKRLEEADSVRLDLLKSTYRLEPQAQPKLYEIANGVRERSGLTCSVTLYQAQTVNTLNAALAYVPGEAHLILSGPMGDVLSEKELNAVHRAGLVAPLQGAHAIHVENNRLWFEEARAGRPVHAHSKLRQLEQSTARAVDVVGQYRMDMRVEQGADQIVNLQVGVRGDPMTCPVYLPGYVSWEHEVGHHDPLTDVFVLGLILGSCASGLDLSDPDDLTTFVQGRRNLCNLNPHLHPVLAKAITRMRRTSAASSSFTSNGTRQMRKQCASACVDVSSTMSALLPYPPRSSLRSCTRTPISSGRRRPYEFHHDKRRYGS